MNLYWPCVGKFHITAAGIIDKDFITIFRLLKAHMNLHFISVWQAQRYKHLLNDTVCLWKHLGLAEQSLKRVELLLFSSRDYVSLYYSGKCCCKSMWGVCCKINVIKGVAVKRISKKQDKKQTAKFSKIEQLLITANFRAPEPHLSVFPSWDFEGKLDQEMLIQSIAELLFTRWCHHLQPCQYTLHLWHKGRQGSIALTTLTTFFTECFSFLCRLSSTRESESPNPLLHHFPTLPP